MKKYRIFYSALCAHLGKRFGANSVFSEDEAKNRGKTGQVHRCLPRDGESMRIKIYRVMTQEEFIKQLDFENYSYEIEGDRIIVTNDGNVILDALTSLPPGVKFRNKGDVFLRALTSLPPGVEFRNQGDVYLDSLTSLSPGVEFRNGGYVSLRALKSLPPGVEFMNRGDVYLRALNSLPPGVVFRNVGDVRLSSLIDGWFDSWKGNIKGINSNSLLNVMIKQGVFQ